MEDVYTEDDLLELLNGRMPAGKKSKPAAKQINAKGADPSRPATIDNAAKLNNVIEITSTPLAQPAMQPIKRVNEEPKTGLGEFARQNYNDVISDNIDANEYFKGLSGKTRSQMDANKEQMDKYLLNLAQRASEEAPKVKSPSLSAQDLLKRYDEEQRRLDAAPKEQDLATVLINSFGPGLLGVATGGYAGADAALATQKFANENMKQEADRVAKERANAVANSGRKLQGIASLAKADADLSKEQFNQEIESGKFKDQRLKTLGEFLKFKMDNGIKDDQKAMELYMQSQKEVSGSAQKGVQEVAETENKALDRASAEERARILGQSQLQRAKIARSEKPPTEGERNSANAYAAMTKAEQAYERMLKDYSGKAPSTDNRLYDKYKSTFENSDGNTLMGTLIRQIPDAKIRRNIQTELDFLAPKLRKESGAAISVGEYIAEGNRYFPRPGDDAETLAEKDASRKQALENFKVGSGRAPIPAIQQPVNMQSKPSSREEMLKRLKQLEGK